MQCLVWDRNVIKKIIILAHEETNFPSEERKCKEYAIWNEMWNMCRGLGQYVEIVEEEKWERGKGVGKSQKKDGNWTEQK